jgi:hypothetical protein
MLRSPLVSRMTTRSGSIRAAYKRFTVGPPRARPLRWRSGRAQSTSRQVLGTL